MEIVPNKVLIRSAISNGYQIKSVCNSVTEKEILKFYNYNNK